MSIAATAATPRTMDDKENDNILRRKRRFIDDDDNDDDDDDDDDDEDNDDYFEKSSKPPGINDSLASTNKGGEKRSGSNVVNVSRRLKEHIKGRSRTRSGSNDATVEPGSKAPPPSQGGKKRSRLNVAIVAWGSEPPQIQRGTNPQQNQRNKREKKERKKEE